MLSITSDCFRDSFFRLLPLEVLDTGILSYLDAKDLTCVARVCHLFSQLASQDVHWKRIFQKKWGFKPCIGPPPFSWKKQYLEVHKIISKSRLGLNKYGEATRINPLEYWRVGHLNEAFFKTDYLVNFFRAVCGEGVEFVGNETTRGPFLHSIPYTMIASFIKMIYAGNTEKTFQFYLKSRKELIKSPCFGFWISRLVENAKKKELGHFSLKIEERLSPPSTPSSYAEWGGFKCFIEGLVLLWLRQKKESEALISLESYFKIRNRSFEEEEDEKFSDTHAFLERLFETVHLASFPIRIWEIIQEQILSLSPSPYKWEVAFYYYKTVDRMKKKLLQMKSMQHLISHLIKNLSSRSQEIGEFQTACLPVSHLKKQGVEGFLLSEIVEIALIVREYEIEPSYAFILGILDSPIFEKKLSFEVLELFYYVKIDLLSRLEKHVEAIKEWRRLGEFYFVNRENRCLKDPVTKTPFFDRGWSIIETDHDALDEILEAGFPLSPHVDLGIAYAHYLKGNVLSANQLAAKAAPHFPQEELGIFLKFNRKKEALQAWVRLASMSPLPDNFFDIGYQLLETSKEACEELIKLKFSQRPHVDIAVAYAHYLTGNFKALKNFKKTVALVDSKALAWLKEAGKKEIEAAFLYAFSIKGLCFIEDYFDGLFDLYPEENLALYFNLASQLTQLGHLEEAMQYIDLAIEFEPDDLKALQLREEILSKL
jgi:hypothetical protein